MNNVFDLKGNLLTNAQINLSNYVAHAKGLPVFAGIVWESAVWQLAEDDPTLQKRGHKHRKSRLVFTNLTSNASKMGKTALRQPFQDFVKALVCRRAAARNQVVDDQQRVIDASRYLESALVTATGAADPAALTLQIFHIAEELIAKNLKDSTAYRVSTKLAHIGGALDEHNLSTTRIGYNSSLKRPLTGDGLDEESQRLGLAKMPSAKVLDALADISHAPVTDKEKIIMRHVDLLVVCGFRIGEVLTLPLDCWVTDTMGGAEPRFGIRYWPEKGGDPIVKWLPAAGVDLAKRAVEELKGLCAKAREATRWMELNSGRLPIFADRSPNDLVGREELARLLGYAQTATVNTLGIEPQGGRGNCAFYRIADVEAKLSPRSFRGALLIRHDGRKQFLSESLSVLFVNQLHQQRPTLSYLVQPLSVQQIQDALGAGEMRGEVTQSIFAARGLMEDGKTMRVRTHAFRHWLNTLADRGGLSDVELARWMGRRDVQQNAAYKHGTVAHRAEKAREMIAQGILIGPVAEAYHSLPPADRTTFLNAAVEAAHHTDLGVCVHNFASSPCKYHLNCLRGCSDYLRTKGDADERAVLLRLKEETERTLEGAKAAVVEGEYGASNFVLHGEETLYGINRALDADNASSVAVGGMTAVFSEGNNSKLLV